MDTEWITWEDLVSFEHISNEDLLAACKNGIITAYNNSGKPLVSKDNCQAKEQQYPSIIYGKICTINKDFLIFDGTCQLENNIELLEYPIFNIYINKSYNEFYILRKDIFPSVYELMALEFIKKGLSCSDIIDNLFSDDISSFIPQNELIFNYPTCVDCRIYNFKNNDEFISAHMEGDFRNNSYEEMYCNKYDINFKIKNNIGFYKNSKITISFSEEERIDYKNAIIENNIQSIEGFRHGDPFWIIKSLDDNFSTSSNIWELISKKNTTVHSYTNKRINISVDDNYTFSCSMKHIFDCCKDFDINISECNENDYKRVMATASFRTEEPVFFTGNNILMDYDAYSHLLYNGLPYTREYAESKFFKGMEILKFRKDEIFDFLQINISKDNYIINKYIKEWKNYFKNNKLLSDNKYKKRAVDVSIIKLTEPELTNDEIWAKFHNSRDVDELIKSKKSEIKKEKKVYNNARKWTSAEFDKASQIPPPDGLPAWPRKWNENERENLLNELAKLYKIKRY